MNPSIIVKGAREHNLKNIDVVIPRNKFVVITGISGSGKSTLAFDTIYAEGQRRYVESLSAYARQFLEQMSKPDVDSIDGLSPAISIEQRTVSKNPRSTVGTATEIYDHLRLLFARIGVPHCYKCGRPISSQTVSEMVDKISSLPDGSRITILAPIVRRRKGEYAKELESLKKAGFLRVRIDNKIYELGEEIKLDKNKKHNIDLIVDRLTVRPEMGNRLPDSLETALKFGSGVIKIKAGGDDERGGEKSKISAKGGSASGGKNQKSKLDEFLLSEKSACADCGVSYPDLTPQMFSFNNPIGACQDCTGLGTKMYFDPDLVVPNKNLSLREGAIAPWPVRVSLIDFYFKLAKEHGFNINTPWKDLPDNVRAFILNGNGPFEGVLPHLERRWRDTGSFRIKNDLERYMNVQPCPTCRGARLKKESLHVKIHGHTIADITRLSVLDAHSVFHNLPLTKKESDIAQRIIKEIRERLTFLIDVGLSYLTLDRKSGTLAGGEGQRIRLATQIGSALTGVLYVLDEPSIGLHQRDNLRLIDTLKRLRDLGNTVLVVEHDRETILASDYIIDMGPGAGLKGGHIVATGTPTEILDNKSSLTGDYLAGRKVIPIPKGRRSGSGRQLVVKGAHENNLRHIDVRIPLGTFTAITGVSGSGKSTLINETLYKGLIQRIYRSKIQAGKVDEIVGIENLDKVVNIDQSPIGRTPRSNPATYTGMFTFIRDLFASLPASKVRGYKPGRFSFNVRGGRCEACEGDGLIRIEMQFLPDVYVECEACRGKRFNRETLEIEYKGKNIADILKMTVGEAAKFFENIPSIRAKLKTLMDVGLGYIELGQSATTLSGGEAQRIKLSKELSHRATGRTLYILDEPTTGLHFADIQNLLDVLNKLVDAGNTVVVIEHNLDVVKCADCVIDLGPEGGDAGGEVVATGTPEELTREARSYTGRYLEKILE